MSESIPFPHDPEQERRLPVDLVRQLAEQILIKKSMFKFDATTVVDRLLDADLAGVQSHGIRLLGRYVNWMDRGDVDPRARILLEHETEAIAVFDGSTALGQVAATKAMKTAIEKAKAVGIGAATVYRSQHLGAAAAYACLASVEGLIGFCTTNSGGPTVSAPGTNEPVTANNPHAWAIPSGDEAPVVIDFACGAASWGKVDAYKRYGQPLPSDQLAVDDAGNPTTDAEAAKVMQPSGRERGFGMALVASILSGALSGGKLPHMKTGSPSADGSEHFLLAIDPGQFGDADRFAKKISQMRSNLTGNDDENVRLPGQNRRAIAADIQENGLPLHRTDVEMLESLAREHKVEIPWSV